MHELKRDKILEKHKSEKTILALFQPELKPMLQMTWNRKCGWSQKNVSKGFVDLVLASDSPSLEELLESFWDRCGWMNCTPDWYRTCAEIHRLYLEVKQGKGPGWRWGLSCTRFLSQSNTVYSSGGCTDGRSKNGSSKSHVPWKWNCNLQNVWSLPWRGIGKLLRSCRKMSSCRQSKSLVYEVWVGWQRRH